MMRFFFLIFAVDVREHSFVDYLSDHILNGV